MDILQECWNKTGRKWMVQSSQDWPQKLIYSALRIRRWWRRGIWTGLFGCWTKQFHTLESQWQAVCAFFVIIAAGCIYSFAYVFIRKTLKLEIYEEGESELACLGEVLKSSILLNPNGSQFVHFLVIIAACWIYSFGSEFIRKKLELEILIGHKRKSDGNDAIKGTNHITHDDATMQELNIALNMK